MSSEKDFFHIVFPHGWRDSGKSALIFLCRPPNSCIIWLIKSATSFSFSISSRIITCSTRLFPGSVRYNVITALADANNLNAFLLIFIFKSKYLND